MTKKRHQQIDVLIEKVGYPNRARGVELIPVQTDEVDAFLEIYQTKRDMPRGRAIVAKGGIPGQIYRATTGRTRGEAKEVTLCELLERSPLEKASACSASERCGGCCYQTLSYEAELMMKGQQIQELFRQAGFTNLRVPIQRSPLVQGYRNKMEYTFGDAEKDGPLVLGLHRPRHFYEIVETPDCNIVPPDFTILRAFIQDFCREKGLTYYHRRERQGYLRHLVVRASLTRQELMLNLVTTSQEGLHPSDIRELLRRLDQLPLTYTLTSVYHTINDSPADAVIAEKVELWSGRAYLIEELMGLTFHVGPFSFFQPNVFGAENLYRKAVELAGDLTGKTVYDLYSGTGTITQIMAKRAQRAVGVEIVEEAVEKARESAERNEIVNAKFIANDVLKELDALAASEEHPEVIVLDPPREGLHPKALPKICAAKADRIIYISCNPTTLVRDLVEMEKLGYRVTEARAYDQFSRTRHVETVVLMSRVEGK
ncbi:MAG: 23S rRNA (uracil(1939)-C(5))-methyltransferase RlmD [Ndongobacter sp.]|nr:23S rRNA (uracil(1939)-C(5))-methyltransferase RlmD [Ndongobacter sp.]